MTKLESSDARNTAAVAISSDSPKRPIGIDATIWLMASFGRPAIHSVYPAKRLLPRRASAFMDFIAEQFSGDPALN